MLRRTFVGRALAAAAAPALRTSGERLAEAARRQVGVTTGYDPNYTRMAYPGGDVPRQTGVCADVVVRAARDALGLDLQRLVHDDMARDFAAYPKTWKMRGPDSNIDHRRVLNLEVYWRRQGAQRWAGSGRRLYWFPGPFEVGDEVTFLLSGKLPHVAIVVSTGFAGARIVHNIGGGVEEIALVRLMGNVAKGHFRWPVG